jgi:Arc/MetJ-type ribon-helix-helix transcriptional regulator
MSIALPPELEAWAQAQVAAGRAESVDALAAAALTAAKRREDYWRRIADEAITEGDRDGWIDGDDFLAEMQSWIDADLAEIEPTPSRAAE